MFEALSDRFEGVLGRLKGKGKLTEADVDDALREIRLALLEADVNFTVVKNFVGRVRERCLGEELSKARQAIVRSLVPAGGAGGMLEPITPAPWESIAGTDGEPTKPMLANALPSVNGVPLIASSISSTAQICGQ